MRHKQASSFSFKDHHNYKAAEQVSGENICFQPHKYIVGKRTSKFFLFYEFCHKTSGLEHEMFACFGQPSGKGLGEAHRPLCGRLCRCITSLVPMSFLTQDVGLLGSLPQDMSASHSPQETLWLQLCPALGHRRCSAGLHRARNANILCYDYIQLWEGPICTSFKIFHIRRM